MRSLVERDVIVDNLLDVVEDHRLRLRVLEENIQGVEQGVAGPHNLLSATHGDTVTAAVSRGALAYGSSTPAWAALAIGAAGTILRSDGTDVAWATLGTAGIAPNDAQYVVMTASGDLTVERVLSAGDGLTRTDGGAGNSVTLAVGAGTGIAVNANDVQLSHLGIESLTDPNDDRILFWDDGAGATAWLDPGSGPVISGTTLNVDHDACTNFVGDEHVAHSGVSITAGAGLTGGGTIAATRTIDVGAGDGITVNANDVALTTPGTCTVATGNAAAGNHTHAITTSSSPGASASILASNASGLLRVVGLGIGANGAADWIIMADGAHIGQAAGPALEFDNTNDYLEITGCEVGIGTTAPDRLLHVEVSDAETSVVTYATRLTHVTSGTAADGFGVGIEFELEDDNGINRVAVELMAAWHTVANEYSQFELWTLRGAGNLGESAVIVAPHVAGTLVANARGVGSVDLQGYRTNVNQVAGGTFCAIVAGMENRIHDWAATGGILAGEANYIDSCTGAAICGGYGNAVDGQFTFIGAGSNNIVTSSGQYSAVFGGEHQIEAYYTLTSGHYAFADKYGQVVSAAGRFAAVGDAQGTIQMVARRVLSTHVVDTWYALYLDGAAFAQRMTIAASSAWTVYCSVVGITQFAAQQWSYELIALIERDNAGNTTLANQIQRVIFESDANYDSLLSADDVNEALRVMVRRTGGVDYDVRWTATIRTSETTYP